MTIATNSTDVGGPLAIDVPMLPPPVDLNARLHYHARAKLNKDVASQLLVVFNNARSLRPDISYPIEHCTLEVTFILPTWRDIDPDNLEARVKSWIDLLRVPVKEKDIGVGIIRDDNWKCLRRLVTETYYLKSTPSTRLVITPLAEPCLWWDGPRLPRL